MSPYRRRHEMLPDLENCDGEQEQAAERQSSTRSCPSSFSSSVSRRTQFPRRSLKELRIDVGRNLEPLVHRVKPGLERITEDPVTPTNADGKPIPPPRLSRSSCLSKKLDGVPPSECSEPRSEQTVVERIEHTLHTHYYTIAYTLVIVAYLIGFAEYLYFRLVSLFIPERITYHPTCDEKQDRRVGKDGFHYGVSIGAFIAIALFQLICFFGLTISENWTVCRQEYSPLDQIVKMRYELAAHIRKTISQSMYRTFLCYGICSFINCGIIFYMVAIQDSLGDTVSTVFMYIFDVVVILYFIAFPLTTVIYHPHVHCFQSTQCTPRAFPSAVLDAVPKSQSSTLESTLSHDPPPLEPIEYAQSPRRPPRTSTIV